MRLWRPVFLIMLGIGAYLIALQLLLSQDASISFEHAFDDLKQQYYALYASMFR